MRDRDRRVPGAHKPAIPVQTASLRPVRDPGKPGRWAPLASTYTRAHMHPHKDMYTHTCTPTHTYTHAHVLSSLPELTEITFRTDEMHTLSKIRAESQKVSFIIIVANLGFPPN